MSTPGKALFDRFWRISAADDNTRLNFGQLAILFEGHRTADTKPGEFKLSIYNLNPEHRTFNERKHTNIEVTLGYRDYHGLCFKGAVEFGSSSDDGAGTWCTEVTLKDGTIHWRNIFINKAFKKDTPQTTVINELFSALTSIPPNITAQFQQVNQALQGQKDDVPISLFPKTKGQTKTPKIRKTDSQDVQLQKNRVQLQASRAKGVVVKAARGRLVRTAALDKLDILCKSYGLRAVWDLQALNIFADNLYLTKEAISIGPNSGLIGSPEKIETGWKFRCELHHELAPGALVYLESFSYTGLILIRRLDFKGQSHDGGEWVNIVEGSEFSL